ncbi:hypothetical protein L484_025910 [Morus notabilis]|uniref:Uncharacterized protein n=1 Tax=Morus notabilis TaxID=981085 RepID=W9RI25_9ROSA|nr:hypothetical protein L484_025910 [Morus notabilis]
MLPHRHPTVRATAPTAYDPEAFTLLKQEVEALEIDLLRLQVDTLRQQIAALQFIILPSAVGEDIIEVNPFALPPTIFEVDFVDNVFVPIFADEGPIFDTEIDDLEVEFGPIFDEIDDELEDQKLILNC